MKPSSHASSPARVRWWLALWIAALLTATPLVRAQQTAAKPSAGDKPEAKAEAYTQLKYRLIGPFRGDGWML
ncbi:hypothetical protein [Chloracidobacterium aggregatum]|uniref:hypothetical protein n=1 Tax=Chloracidobacterium aggregatum TaxID=2851959 RepID=UPI00201716BA|nr:hypothetical protein [Chloracidobacterium aggregatum]